MISRKIYSDVVIKQIPRLLGYINTNKNSRNYGCFDRNFWHYKFVDFPCARLQEMSLTLALLFKRNYPGNLFFKNDEIRDLSIGGIVFWTGIQNNDGSFNEWYPNEHSFVATVFSLYAISEAYKLLKPFISPKKRNEIEFAIANSGKWLTKHDEKTVSNQQACAVCALYNAYLVTKNKKFLRNVNKKFKILLKLQSSEGWFPEYGGPDIGYFSILIDYLAKYYKLSKNRRIIKNVDLAIDFLKFFVHPDFTIGGEYGSRNTEYIFPHGLEVFSFVNTDAKKIANAVLENLKKFGLKLDDRYLFYHSYNFLQAYDDFCPRQKNLDLPFKKNFKKYFPHAKIFVASSPTFYSIFGLGKGGILKIFDKKQKNLILDDCGLSGRLSDGKYVSTQWLDKDYEIETNEDFVSVSGKLHLVREYNLTPLSSITLRSAQSVFGNKMSRFIKEKLRKNLIRKSKTLPIKFQRTISLQKEKIDIKNTILIQKKSINFDNLTIGGKFSLIYTPSSRFFTRLDSGYELNKKELKKLNKNKNITITNSLSL